MVESMRCAKIEGILAGKNRKEKKNREEFLGCYKLEI
jgi:hypothetical protein